MYCKLGGSNSNIIKLLIGYAPTHEVVDWQFGGQRGALSAKLFYGDAGKV